jgi:hypothetical protein
MFGEKIGTQYRFVDCGLNEWNIREEASAEGDRFVDFSPGFNAGTVCAGERRPGHSW